MTPSDILDAAPVGIAVMRAPALEYELANPAFLELAGGGEDPVGRPLADVHPALAALLAAPAAEVARHGAPLEEKDVPLPPRSAGEHRRWATFRLRALPDEPGRGRAVLVVAAETTGSVIARVHAEALAALAADLGEGTAMADLLERATARARELLGADTAFVLLADADSPRFRGAVKIGGGTVEVAADAVDLPAGSLAIDRREPIVFRVDEARGLEAAWLQAAGMGSALCAPLTGSGRSLGLLYLTWSTRAPAPTPHVAFAAGIASACTIAVQRARILRREREAHLASQRATERLEVLAESGALLTGAVDWSTVVRTTAQLGLGFLADAAVLDLVAADGVLRREALEAGGDPPSPSVFASMEHVEVESPTIRDALVTRRTRRIVMPAGGGAGESGDPDLVTLDALRATSCIAAPLVIRGRAAGVLTLVRRAPSPPHEPEDVALATEIARRAALALDDARLIAAAADQAAARDAFLAAAAHDLRSPLTALRLQVEAVERSAAVTERGRPRVARLRGSVERLARQVEQVLDAARAGPRGAPVQREPLDLAELARAVVTRVQRERRRNAPAVRVVAPDPVPGRWDPSRVDGIVANLIAVSSKRGGDEVEVRVTPQVRGGRIEVHRPGTATAPYGQEAAAHEELEVGIWIARRFAESHGGQLRVVRLPHSGALFTVDLPG